MRILYDNEVFNATISVSTEDPDYDFDTALNDTRLSRYGRTILDSDQWIKFSFASAIDVDYVYMCGNNIQSGATVKIQANATDSWDAPSIDQALTRLDSGNYIYNFSTTESYQYWRIYVDDSTNPDEYIQIAYIFIGEELTMPGMNPEAIIPYTSNAAITKSLSGQLYGDKRVRLKGARIAFPIIENSKKVQIETFFDYVDLTIPFLMLFWEDDLDVEPPLYCSLLKSLEWNKNTGSGLTWNIELEFEECR